MVVFESIAEHISGNPLGGASLHLDRLDGSLSSVKLVPFPHQVGGHAGLMTLDEQTICKPQNDQEQHFYEHLPMELETFVPRYKGVTNVFIEQHGDGFLDVMACPSPVYHNNGSSYVKRHESHSETKSHNRNGRLKDGRCRANYRVRLACNGNLRIDQDSDGDDLFEEVSLESSVRRFGCNPWSMHCHRRQVAKMHCTQESKSHKFMLLENVTHNYKFPCILDIKMGVRSYGDDQSEEKKKAHIEKVNASTSAKLGIRICGMQVYRMDKERFHCKNKYFGRRLSEEGVKTALKLFLFNGYHLRLDLIKYFIRRTRQLVVTLSDLNSYRFFGSSLLLIYEGINDSAEVSVGSILGREDSCCWSQSGPATDKLNGITFMREDSDNHRDYYSHTHDIELSGKLDDRGYVSEFDSGCGKSSADSLSDSESDMWLDEADNERESVGWDTDEAGGSKEAEYPNPSKREFPSSPTCVCSQCVKGEESSENETSDESSEGQSCPSTESEACVLLCQKCVAAHHKSNEKCSERFNDQLMANCALKNPHSVSRHKYSTSSIRSKSKEHKKENLLAVDLKMIDFAHAFIENDIRSGDTTYEGPDGGYLYGLKNLLEILQQIYDEHKCDLGSNMFS